MLLTSLLPMAMLTTVMTVQQRRRNQNTSRTGRALSETNVIGNLFFRHQQSE